MALVNWLKKMDMDKRIDLDALLSVKIPAYLTPEKTRKMLAVTAVDEYDGMRLSKNNVREYTKTYNLSDLLNNYNQNTSDERFLQVAEDYFANLDTPELYPSHYKQLKSDIDYYKKLINSIRNEIELLGKRIEAKRETLDRSDPAAVSRFNSLVDQYNEKLQDQETLTERWSLT